MEGLILWALELTESNISKTANRLLGINNFAVGNDLVHIPGFKSSCTALFKNKVYTPGELTYCDQFDDSLLHYASTWAAKEAVYKALKQLDPSPTSWKKIEITRKKTGGQPDAIIHGITKLYNISLSITHDGDYVWAIAFIQNKGS